MSFDLLNSSCIVVPLILKSRHHWNTRNESVSHKAVVWKARRWAVLPAMSERAPLCASITNGQYCRGKIQSLKTQSPSWPKRENEKDPFITGIFTKATHTQRERMKHTTRTGYSFHPVNSAEGGGRGDMSTGLRDKVKSHFQHLLTTQLGEMYSTHPTFCFIFWKMILMMPASQNCF